MRTTLVGLSILAAMAAAAPAVAEDAPAPASDFTVTGGATLTSDYRFRGVSQTDKRFAVQGTIGVSHSSGFYVGTWGSSIDDYVATGGRLEEIQGAQMNIGSEALSAWMFHEASKPNPFGLLGAMWVIEGLGAIKAKEWGRAIKESLSLPDQAVRFLLYHGENDAGHIGEFQEMLSLVLPDEAVAQRIVRTAEVTARLYALQIEEIGT